MMCCFIVSSVFIADNLVDVVCIDFVNVAF